MRSAPSPEEALTQAQQRAADELACCAIEHASRLANETVLSCPDGRKRLIAKAAALLAYAYVDFCERYGGVEPGKLRGIVIDGVAMHAPLLSNGGTG